LHSNKIIATKPTTTATAIVQISHEESSLFAHSFQFLSASSSYVVQLCHLLHAAEADHKSVLSIFLNTEAMQGDSRGMTTIGRSGGWRKNAKKRECCT
jgi:hypothetical protein